VKATHQLTFQDSSIYHTFPFEVIEKKDPVEQEVFTIRLRRKILILCDDKDIIQEKSHFKKINPLHRHKPFQNRRFWHRIDSILRGLTKLL
jgi:hypothetical protein